MGLHTDITAMSLSLHVFLDDGVQCENETSLRAHVQNVLL